MGSKKQETRLSSTSPASSDYYRVAFDTTNEAIFIHDIDTGQILDVNERMLEMYQYTREDIASLNVTMLSAPDKRFTAQRAFGLIQKAVHEGPQLFEWLARKKTAEHFWVEVALRASQVQGKKRLLAAVRDISNRKATEDALLESESRYRTLFESAHDAILLLQGDRFIECNAKTLEMFGCQRRDQIVGHHPFEFSPNRQPDGRASREIALEKISAAFNAEPQFFDWTHRRVDGSEFDAEVNLKKLIFSSGSVVLVVVRDVTARLRAARELRQARNLTLAAIEQSPAGILLADAPDGMIRIANAAALSVRGATDDALIGIPFELHAERWQFFHPDGRLYRKEELPLWRAIKNDESVDREEMVVRSQDGRERILIANATRIIDENGNCQAGILLFQDLTEQRKAEESTAALEAKMQQAQKLESLGVLAGGIAHDFNNLLVGIMGNAGLALMELKENNPIRESVEAIEHSAERAADLVKQMLAYSGKGRFVVERVELGKVIRETLSPLDDSLSNKVALRLAIAEEPVHVEVDVGQLRQIVANLVTNASESIGDASGRIEINTGVEICGEAALAEMLFTDELKVGRYAFFEIADNGPGMDSDTLGKIFDPFFSTKFTGRGLGLPAVLGIIRGHRGAIKVKSEPSYGTRIKVFLPAVNLPQDRLSTQPMAATKPLESKGCVLIIDDEESVLTVATRMLQKLGFQVVSADGGEAALALFAADPSKFDAVILDMTMPHMDGVQCLSELKKIDAGVRVILSSGYDREEIVARFKGMDFAGFVQKPYRIIVLSDELNKVLDLAAED